MSMLAPSLIIKMIQWDLQKLMSGYSVIIRCVLHFMSSPRGATEFARALLALSRFGSRELEEAPRIHHCRAHSWWCNCCTVVNCTGEIVRPAVGVKLAADQTSQTVPELCNTEVNSTRLSAAIQCIGQRERERERTITNERGVESPPRTTASKPKTMNYLTEANTCDKYAMNSLIFQNRESRCSRVIGCTSKRSSSQVGPGAFPSTPGLFMTFLLDSIWWPNRKSLSHLASPWARQHYSTFNDYTFDLELLQANIVLYRHCDLICNTLIKTYHHIS